jgi:hypothetical protein
MSELNCRCNSLQHANHLRRPCSSIASEPDGYCRTCHDTAADEALSGPVHTTNIPVQLGHSPVESHEPNIPTLGLNAHNLTIDGLPVAHIYVSGVFSSDGRTYKEVLTHTEEATTRLFPYTLSQFKEIEVEEFNLRFSVDWQPVIGILRFKPDDDLFGLTVYFDRVYLWSRPYTFSEYFDLLINLINELDVSAMQEMPYEESSADMYLDDFAIRFSVNADANIGLEVERCLSVVRLGHEKAIAKLESEVKGNSVELSFDFPEEVRVPCEQYLLYFVQFLKDLGVEATADLRHEAGKVLFAVTPGDQDTALDNIRTALQTYLQLPLSPLDTDSIVEDEIVVQRLAANVDHLKGQVRLANAELRLANATIQQQQITLERVLSNDMVIKSLKASNPMTASEEPERLLGGTVALTTFDKYGVRVSLGEVFRKLRRVFGDVEDKDYRT